MSETTSMQEKGIENPIPEGNEQPQKGQTSKTSSPKVYTSREEVIARLKEAIEEPVNEVRGEVDKLKSAFYRIRKSEVEEERLAFIEQGGKLEDFSPSKDNMEETLKALLNDFKQKRTSYNKDSQEKQEHNYKTKVELLERMKSIVDTADEVGKHYSEFQQLRQKWGDVEDAPQMDMNKLWKEYQNCVERFYDLLKINKELREYDFKKNLELKTALCEAVEKLSNEEDVLSAFHSLQKLHSDWRSIGPVAKELREELWSRFKAASSVINKRHQAFYEQRHEGEIENEKLKMALCEKVEAMDFSTLNSGAKWDEKTKEMIDIQAQWKKIGPAPRKVSAELYDRFRSVCDAFFVQKAAFFKEMRETYGAHLEAKKKLCEAAEALKDSKEWKSTTDKLIMLQKEWKKIGPVPKKHSDELWNRFITACNAFFDRKKENMSEMKNAEVSNLQAKKAVIEKLKSIDENLPKAELLSTIKQLISEFNSIGHVPIKDKEKVYEEFNSLVDAFFNRLDMKSSQTRLKFFKEAISERLAKGEEETDGVKGERRRLARQLEAMKNDLSTYENNMGFLNFSSKSSGKLKEEMNRKIEKLKGDIALIEGKIKTITDALETTSNPSEKEKK